MIMNMEPNNIDRVRSVVFQAPKMLYVKLSDDYDQLCLAHLFISSIKVGAWWCLL